MALFDSATMPETFRMGKSFSNNSGSTLSGNPKNFVELKSANGSQTDALRTASGQRANAQNNQGANAATGVTPNPNNQTPPLDLIRINSYQNDLKKQEVGTNINDPRPNDDGEKKGQGPDTQFRGTPSFFNEYYLVRYHTFNDQNDSAIPTKLAVPEGETTYKGMANHALYKNPTTSIIIDTFNGSGGKSSFEYPEKVYTYSDFLYLKHYNPYGNNKLVTLRRFMAPVYDECRTVFNKSDENKKFRRPIARAVNYFNVSGNSLNTLLSFGVGIPVTPSTGGITKTEVSTGNITDKAKQAAENKVTDANSGKSNSSVVDTSFNLLSILAGNSSEELIKNWTSQYDPWKSGQVLQDLVYGPVNVINDSLMRAQGLTYIKADYKVTFEYSLKAIEKINPKAAMMDIMGNMLALTYNHAAFWGGENRYLIDRNNFPLIAPEAIFGALSKLKEGNISAISEFANLFSQSLNNITTNSTNVIEGLKEKGFLGYLSSEEGKSAIQKATTAYAGNKFGIQEIFKGMLGGLGQVLTGNPTGEWHLQIGNPFSPIAMIGNLWCTSASFSFNDELSFDDFPTELKVECTLKNGKSRDASDIQSIFNAGGGRIYYPYKNANIDPNASSATFNTETAVVFNPDNTLGAWNAVSTDRAGLTIENIVTKPGNKSSSKDVAAQIMQTVDNFQNK